MKRTIHFILALFLTNMIMAQNLLNISLGNLLEYDITGDTLEIKTSSGIVSLSFYTGEIVRIHAAKNGYAKKFSYAVIAGKEKIIPKIEESGDILEWSSDSLMVRISKNPVRFSFIHKSSGKLLNADDPSFGISWIGDESTVYKAVQPGERFLGLGEQVGHLDRKGTYRINWNTDNPSYDENSKSIYSSIPFYIGVHKNGAYGIFLDNTSKTQFNFQTANDRFASFSATYGEMDYYFISGSNVAAILKNYGLLTGFIPMPPKWSLGYQQCRWAYFPAEDVLSTAKKFRERKIPADMIYLDINYMDNYKIFTWHPEMFSDPKALLSDLKNIGFNTAAIFDPGIKIEKGYPAYDDGIKKDIFVKYPDGSCYAGEVWPGWCNFPDFSNPDTRLWWGNQFSQMVNTGLTGFWNDMNEIAAWGVEVPDLIEFDWEGEKTSYKEAKNVYGLLMARSTYEGTRKAMNGERPFVLTRAGFSGLQRYSAIWTGDNQAEEDHMLLGIRMVTSLGLSGVPFCGYDVGGFGGSETPELYTRWMTIGAFSPMYRGHTSFGTMRSEPWVFGELAEDITRRYIQFRYRLMPYIYSCFYNASQTGMPVARSLAIDYTSDARIYEHTYENQYLFGDFILVAPVKGNENFCKVYLPEGTWYSLFNDRKFEGNNEYLVEAPLAKLPVYVREGAILPMQNNVQNLKEPNDGILYLHIYKGTLNTSFTIYEDDGHTYDYENGKYLSRTITYNPEYQSITVKKPTGGYLSGYKKLKLILHGFDKEVMIESGLVKQKVVSENLDMLTSEFKFHDFGPEDKVNVKTAILDLTTNETIIKLK